MDRLTAISVFLDMAKSGSFTATAERLNMSRPMVTRHILLMEEWLNVRLFHRTTRQVNLTEAGKQAVEYFQHIANIVQQLEDEIGNQTGELKGTLRLTSSHSFNVSHLTHILYRFQLKHPQVNIFLDSGDKNLDLVDDRIDLAIRITDKPDPHLIAKKLAPCHSALVASPNYFAQYGMVNTPEELIHHRCLTHFNMNHGKWSLQKQGQSYYLPLNNVFTTNDALSLLNMALVGNGIALLPRYLISEHLKTGNLDIILKDWQLPELGIFALYTSRRQMSRTLRALLDFLSEVFKQQDW